MDVLDRGLVAAVAGVAGVAGIAAAVVAAAPLTGCKPELDQRATVIAAPRVLAVREEPAEAAPRDDVAFSALVVGADGAPIPSPAATWAFCTARKPLAELGPVSPECHHGGASDTFLALGAGAKAKGTIPESACRDFGPDVPQAKPGEAYARPADPDPTGGYYQPLSLFVGGDVAVEQARIACGVAGAPSEDVVTFRQRYHANENPRIAAMTVDGAPVAEDASASPLHVAPGARVTVAIAWPACPEADVCGDGVCGPDETRASCADDCGGAAPKGCQGSERYLWFDPAARALVVRREEMRASWFASGGLFDRDRTGRVEDDRAPTSDDAWVAPSEAAVVRAWVVLRDARGGVAWRGVTFDVR